MGTVNYVGQNADKDDVYLQDNVLQDPFDNRVAHVTTPTYVKLVIQNHPLFLSIEEMFDGVQGSPFDASGPRSYQRHFLIVARKNIVGPAAVCKCPGVPTPYSPYIPYRAEEYDLSARVVRITARRRGPDGDWQHWVVTVDYSSQLPPGGPPNLLSDWGWPTVAAGWANQPWLEAPHIDFEGETTTRIPDADLDGQPYFNSVRQPYATPVVVDAANSVLVVTRNYQHPGTLIAVREHIDNYSMTVNLDTFVGAPPGAVRLDPVRLTEMYRGRIRYWKAVYRFRFKRRQVIVPFSPPDPLVGNLTQWDTWQPRILDNGMFQWRRSILGTVTKSLPPVPIMRSGHPVSYPVPLNGDGREALPNGVGKITPFYKSYREYRAVQFSSLCRRTSYE